MDCVKLGFFGFCFYLWLPMAAASDNLLSPKGVNYEVTALMAVKIKLKDESNVMNGWDINSVDPCTWNMVVCSTEGFVVSLEMASVGLSGTLSPSIANLSHLQTMRLGKNNLSGQIPKLVANLSGLSFLDLSYNNFSGPTPKILAQGFSITGNNFLCTSTSAQICTGASKPINDTRSTQKVSVHHQWVLSVAIGISCTFVVSVMLLVCWVHWYRSRLLSSSYVQQDYEFDIGHLKRFSFRELQNATGNFSPKNILGQGGYGLVYKGCLPNRTVVAVKRLKDPSYTGEVQFQTEVEMIGLALHRNLLRLYGFCMTSDERLLVRTLFEEKKLEVLVDRDLRGCFDAFQLEKAVEVALQCTQSHPNLRPKMSEVLKVLEGLVESGQTEDSQSGTNLCEARACSFSRIYSDVQEESSFIIEAMELSGPR
ncbi:putative lrr receptor-like serine/threonine-protein kinase [Quercus suber]|uniref:Lrr receptor-like serine/threonine-protein kinase n=1 Tax=Quercus suber TaxID=58331 RepID=A0AAW0J5Y1_QUESU